MEHKYVTVARRVRELIESSLAPHDALPSERDLMETYGVSRMTVRQALARLTDEGLIYTIRGSGTYVGSREIFSKTPKLTSFTEDLTRRGFVASSRTLAAAGVKADEDVARHLRLTLGDPCILLKRLRLADDVPIAIEEVYLPEAILTLDQLDLGASLYAQLAEAGYEVIRAEQELTAMTLTPEQCELLAVPDGSAALCVVRVSSSRQGRLVEFARDVYRADRYSFQFAVTRDSPAT